jgi:hypothetical protein
MIGHYLLCRNYVNSNLSVIFSAPLRRGSTRFLILGALIGSRLATLNNAKIPSYAKVYVAPIPGGFENYIIAGLRNKKVPLTVVIDRTKADYEISGVSDSEKAGWAKMLFIGSQNSNEQASIKISNLTGAVIFGYSVHKTNSARGKQSAGEACAKHIKQIVLE